MNEFGVNGKITGSGNDHRVFGPRVLLAIRDPRLERPLFPGVNEESARPLRIVGRALDGDSLLAQVEERTADAVLVSDDLTGLTPTLLRALAEYDLALLVVSTTNSPLPTAWQELGAREILPPLDPASVARLIASARRQRVQVSHGDEFGQDEDSRGKGHLLAVTSGKGSPGKTTVALNLAVGLAAQGAEVCLVDLDLTGGDVVAYLGLDPRANLFTLAHAAAGQKVLADEVVTPELQLFGKDSFVWVLVGIAQARMAAALTDDVVRLLLAYLLRRFAYVVVDQSALPHGSPKLTRIVLEEAARVLMVCGGDLVAAWHAQQAIATLTESFAAAEERIGLVVNRHDVARQPSPEQIARAMEWDGDILGTIPYAYRAAQEAQRDQQPLILHRGAVARAIEALAARVHAEFAHEAACRETATTASRQRVWPRISLGRGGAR